MPNKIPPNFEDLSPLDQFVGYEGHELDFDARRYAQNYLDEQQVRGNEFVLNPFIGNLRLITEDPLVLTKNDSQPQTSRISSFEKHLRQFWDNAEYYLFLTGIERDRLVTEQDLTRYQDANLNSQLSETQKNALEVLRCVREIQKLFYRDQPVYLQEGRPQFDPLAFVNNAEDATRNVTAKEQLASMEPDEIERSLNLSFSEFGLIMMRLTLAAIKSDFYHILWPRIQEASKHEHTRAKNQDAAKARSEAMKKYSCEHWQRLYAEEQKGHPGLTKSQLMNGAIKALQKELSQKYKMDLKKIPEQRTIKKYIQSVRWPLKQKTPVSASKRSV